MTRERVYPDEPAGPFEAPPREFEDGEARKIRVEVADDEDREALVGMYVEFDPADRAQGIPPAGERRVRDWLDHLFEEGLNVVAVDGDRAVGHATLVPDDRGGYELAIFVTQEYQGAGIGTRLIEALLGYAAEEGAERVWLTVERWNRPAIGLYESVGFEPCGSDGFEREMSIRLA